MIGGIVLILLAAPAGSGTPANVSAAPSSQPTSCGPQKDSSSAQQAANRTDAYPESYHQAERLTDNVERMRECLSDEEVSDSYGASDTWDRIDETTRRSSTPKQPKAKPKIIKPKD